MTALLLPVLAAHRPSPGFLASGGPRGGQWAGYCSCGWISPEDFGKANEPGRALATKAADQHLAEAIMQALQ